VLLGEVDDVCCTSFAQPVGSRGGWFVLDRCVGVGFGGTRSRECVAISFVLG